MLGEYVNTAIKYQQFFSTFPVLLLLDQEYTFQCFQSPDFVFLLLNLEILKLVFRHPKFYSLLSYHYKQDSTLPTERVNTFLHCCQFCIIQLAKFQLSTNEDVFKDL